ncbi:hypothetical protein GGQ87_001625 [Brevundimonas alba]|uniref:Uncharacterized protein n=1 Tax=Brevundimonas alba TaxID=74314 RepID=A0A7X5YK04_9CAUL|nr:hypothetical protein [Brevundimonas alba]NJC41367.1 hypothetical protein [Brevundimonas alba]
MISAARCIITAAALAGASAAVAEERPYYEDVSTGQRPLNPGVGADVFYSSDADESETLKLGLNLDWDWQGPDSYQGVRIETARFTPLGTEGLEEERIYYRFARKGSTWSSAGMIGTNGETLIGSVSVYNDSPRRQEYFVERDRLETPQGLAADAYTTLAGAALDVPLDDFNSLTFLAGLQDFGGDNLRTHLRARYVHVVKPEWGLSAQLRTRYFQNSEPAEGDYFSPRWYVELLPTVQVQRFHDGWRYQVAVGLGAQRDADTDWRAARFFEASVTSPKINREWYVKASVVHSNTPGASGYAYDYSQLNIALTRGF